MATVVTRLELSDLKGLYIACKCGASIEFSTAHILSENPHTCPCCKTPYHRGDQNIQNAALRRFVNVVEDLNRLDHVDSVELVISDNLQKANTT